ncbi:WD40 repeat-like protein [Aaosphaeria arxii CBS 175.79]|uniref:WD40 repeat-like protein n=1 Tax=Aaosphaeria arxii CBS 175.79 TaxID=1450172 RepID=A0A6A5XKP8_9PLEO|nr:WD40 repeat-like protein [Aaosphaeria arxii CBS 175.79]KAF2013377.1 WD40 repeat-like protein [Aaosphaeria arxii CBS 175.79]
MPGYDTDFEGVSGQPEAFLSVINKDAFVSVTTFFNHFVPHKEPPLALDIRSPPEFITREDLRGDRFDIQGIDWALRNTTRANVRSRRAAYEESRLEAKQLEVRERIEATPNRDNYYSFKRLNTNHQVFIPHFQLRNLLTATSHDDIYYAERDLVLRTDASGGAATVIQNLTKERFEGNRFTITTLASSDDVLIAGGFEGEYAVTHLSSCIDTPTTIGHINCRSRESKSHITNHIHLSHSRHNYSPQAVLSSNDNRLRVLDICTDTFLDCFTYTHAVNCSATSPNGQMRVVVGDFRETLITDARTGRHFEALRTHTDDAFACDWADDGIHVATAAQDSTIVIWDARNWRTPLKTMRSELSIPRTLKFSPIGGGPRTLISAEADDYVNIINAQTFESRQVLDFFGRVGGVSMTPDGSSLFVANTEPTFGGIMEFERCGWGERRQSPYGDDFENDGVVADWASDEQMEIDSRVVCGLHARDRRGLDLGNVMV